ncbi:acid-sensing ion channel 4-B [Nematostella vectensis]|uniref:acid-sensing ion channel 4-B n=1 Tax=Nematostella vectensis TaxID=45351 RepID=UPI0013900239|nr:acid-sensing ion channel 4-B [Nematostella vectensis]
MVQECSFAGVSCLGYNWTQFWNHLYGNCFVFNTAMIGSNRERNNISYTSSIPGPSDGLLLRLRIEGEEYLGNFSTVSGVRVHISDRHEMPFPGDKGFSVSPGFETSVGMRKVFIHREDPFGNNSCISDVGKPVVRPDYYMENFGVNYSTIACRSSCVANLQKTMCGCVESAYAITDELRKIVCNALNSTVFRCIVKANETAEDSDGKSCLTKCAIRCDENIYKLTISSAVFPSPSYQNISSQDLKSYSGNEEQISANLLSLRIFFEEHNYETIEQRKSYELIDFLSDIGGQMGMFVGLSILTCAELIELLALIIMHLFNRDHKRGAVGADTVTPVIELKKKPLVELPRVQ